MAIFLSRIKKALNLGTKSITQNGTYNASTDGYDGFSRVDVNVSGAALQSSKTVVATTSQQTITPDVGYDGMEQVIINPQVHTKTYTPAENWPYNDMGAINNFRYVDTYGMYIPTSITPSDSSPVSLSSGTAYKPTASGYAISSYSSKTPSDSSPASVSSGAIIKASASGYLYATVQPKVKTGSFTSPSAGSTISITCGFQPKKINLVMYTGTNSMMTISYDEDMDSSRQIAGWRTSSSNSGCQQYAMPNSSNNGVISEITTNSFVYRAGSTSPNKTVYYFAVG